MSQVVEIRSYKLKPGAREEFARLLFQRAGPMLARWGVDVIGFGPSLHDDNSYCLMRCYDSVESRRQSQNEFYGSDEWREGLGEAILACIESYSTVVLSMEDDVVAGLRRSWPAAAKT